MSGRATTASSSASTSCHTTRARYGHARSSQPVAVPGRQRRVGQQHRPAARDREPRVPPPRPGVVRAERAAVDPLHERRRAVAVGGRHSQPRTVTPSVSTDDLLQPARAPAGTGAGFGSRVRVLVGRRQVEPDRVRRLGPSSSAARRRADRPAPGTATEYTASHASRRTHLAGRRVDDQHRAAAVPVAGDDEALRVGRPGPLGRVQVAELGDDTRRRRRVRRSTSCVDVGGAAKVASRSRAIATRSPSGRDLRHRSAGSRRRRRARVRAPVATSIDRDGVRAAAVAAPRRARWSATVAPSALIEYVALVSSSVGVRGEVGRLGVRARRGAAAAATRRRARGPSTGSACRCAGSRLILRSLRVFAPLGVVRVGRVRQPRSRTARPRRSAARRRARRARRHGARRPAPRPPAAATTARVSSSSPSGSGRSETNSSDPSGRNAGAVSPFSERVSRTHSPPSQRDLPQRGHIPRALRVRPLHASRPAGCRRCSAPDR